MKFHQQVHVDEVGKVILENLIDSKEKMDKVEKEKDRWKWTSFLFLFIFIIYFCRSLTLSQDVGMTSILSILLNENFCLYMVLAIAASYGFFKMVVKKYEKVEDEFEALRCEVIQRSEEIWPNPNRWQKRHEAFSFLQDEYGINLYTEH